MAGIAGILLKNNKIFTETHREAFCKMMKKLAVSDAQSQQSFEGSWFSIGFVQPLGETKNNRIQGSGKGGVICLIEGLVQIHEYIKDLIKQRYRLDSRITDHELLPYLFEHYGELVTHYISGWYNLIFIRESVKEAFLVNDRFGILPMYYHDTGNALIFSSKIISLIDTTYVDNTEPDPVTFAEHLFFNYTLSDCTFIKNIRNVPNATWLHIKNGETSVRKYWQMADLFSIKKASEKESLDILNDALKRSIIKLFSFTDGPIIFSLTGGWDSRLILSYLINDYRERLHLFSFGAPGAPDILVPQLIASKENLKYTPIILDDHYLHQYFNDYAKKTIEWSNGTRSYKRTHYVYAIEQMAGTSNYLLSGLFGDEVLKVSGFTDGAVISGNTIEMIKGDFNVDDTIERFIRSGIPRYFRVPGKMLIDGFRNRIEDLARETKHLKAGMEKYYFIRFEKNLRKFFGSEINSYNDYVHCYSPFADYDFLKTFAGTGYMGSELPFNSGDLQLKIRSTLLYTKLVKMNYKSLAFYNSSRGYSMHDATTFTGKTKILFKKKFMLGNRNTDNYNTWSTDSIFHDSLKIQGNRYCADLFDTEFDIETRLISDINSFIYWIGLVFQKNK